MSKHEAMAPPNCVRRRIPDSAIAGAFEAWQSDENVEETVNPESAGG